MGNTCMQLYIDNFWKQNKVCTGQRQEEHIQGWVCTRQRQEEHIRGWEVAKKTRRQQQATRSMYVHKTEETEREREKEEERER